MNYFIKTLLQEAQMIETEFFDWKWILSNRMKVKQVISYTYSFKNGLVFLYATCSCTFAHAMSILIYGVWTLHVQCPYSMRPTSTNLFMKLVILIK
jgi:hypothetical protein